MTEIKISRNRLLETLMRLRHVFYKKNALPILNDYMFELEGSTIKVYVCDGELVASETFTITDDAVTSDKEPRKSWCVNRHYIVPGLRSLDEQEITMQVTDYQLIVLHSCGFFMMPIDDANEYPCNPQNFINRWGFPVEPYLLTLETPGLRHWLDILRPSLAQDELRPVMNGIFFDCTPDGLSLCASDGHKLVRIRKSSISTRESTCFIMPRKVVNMLSCIMPKTGMLNFFFTPYTDDTISVGQIKMKLEEDTEHELTIYFRGIEGRYPNYNSVIPENYDKNVSVDRIQLIKSVNRAMLFCNDSNMMARFSIYNGKIQINAKDDDFEIGSDENVPCQTNCINGLPVTIGLKTNSIMDLIKKVTASRILIKFSDPSRCIIIEPDPQPEVENLTLLCMPMYIND